MAINEQKFCLIILFVISLSSFAAMFTVLYHYNELVKTISVKKDYYSFGTRQFVISSKDETGDEIDNDFENIKIISLKGASKPVIQGLALSISNVERDVLTFNIDDYLKPLSDIPIEESSLLHKIQQKQKDTDFKCVIRVAKYCSSRCRTVAPGNQSREWNPFRCEFSEFCRFETSFVGQPSKELMQSFDVVFFIPGFRDRHLNEMIALRPPGQLWVISTKESPIHDMGYVPPGLTGNPFNLTMTYARDTDIVFPYGSLQKIKALPEPPPIPKKTKLIAAMNGNCNPYYWQRTELINEIQKHLSVDYYGKCGKAGQLPQKNTTETLQQYKFYLSFENSECRDYITEKVWKNSLSNGIVPIVYGSTREGYEKTLPKDSFIFLEDFSNMSAFVDYIHALDEDEARYKKYFDWKIDSKIILHSPSAFRGQKPGLNLCYLVKKLIHVFFYPETSWKKRTPDFASWWLGQCDDFHADKKVLGFNVRRSKEKQAEIEQRW
ncbi:alpha-(1,3)-fucosyltransferase C-like [Lytechinus variegatus]|uniref:alpha-(1,3)-fucosyltransferase C-like n=1 Tax=Lytechinus variegatus TaxID=7654 RepID=UPI001BB1390B|nr:alpha-(1,3)-fucosyltransferase C-like [Lytechinus variegatus]